MAKAADKDNSDGYCKEFRDGWRKTVLDSFCSIIVEIIQVPEKCFAF